MFVAVILTDIPFLMASSLECLRIPVLLGVCWASVGVEFKHKAPDVERLTPIRRYLQTIRQIAKSVNRVGARPGEADEIAHISLMVF